MGIAKVGIFCINLKDSVLKDPDNNCAALGVGHSSNAGAGIPA